MHLQSTSTKHQVQSSQYRSDASTLRDALAELQMSYRSAAQETGISPGCLHNLAYRSRSPSTTIAQRLVSLLPPSDPDSAPLLAEAVPGAGYDRPSDTIANYTRPDSTRTRPS